MVRGQRCRVRLVGAVLEHQILTRLQTRSGAAPNNLEARLPGEGTDLAREVAKYPSTSIIGSRRGRTCRRGIRGRKVLLFMAAEAFCDLVVEARAFRCCPCLIELCLLEQPSVLRRRTQPENGSVFSHGINVAATNGTALLSDLDAGSGKECPIGDASQVHGVRRPFGMEGTGVPWLSAHAVCVGGKGGHFTAECSNPRLSYPARSQVTEP